MGGGCGLSMVPGLFGVCFVVFVCFLTCMINLSSWVGIIIQNFFRVTLLLLVNVLAFF